MFGSTANFVGGFIFSSIGFVALVYGKRMSLWPPIFFGIVLMAYPYFVSNTLLLYGIGVLLTALLYYFRD